MVHKCTLEFPIPSSFIEDEREIIVPGVKLIRQKQSRLPSALGVDSNRCYPPTHDGSSGLRDGELHTHRREPKARFIHFFSSF